MKIRCRQEREGGSKITIDDTIYHFSPDENGHHVAEVSDKKHIRRFLSIKEGYHEHSKEPNDEDEAKQIKLDEDDSDLTAEEISELGMEDLLALSEKYKIEVKEKTPVPVLRTMLINVFGLKKAE